MGQFSSVAQSCPTLCDPMDCSTPGFPNHHQLPQLAQTRDIASVMPSSHLVLCRPRLLLPSVLPGRCSLPRAGRVFPLPLRLPTPTPAPPRLHFLSSSLSGFLLGNKRYVPQIRSGAQKLGLAVAKGQSSLQGKNLRYPCRLNAVNISLALWFPSRG